MAELPRGVLAAETCAQSLVYTIRNGSEYFLVDAPVLSTPASASQQVPKEIMVLPDSWDAAVAKRHLPGFQWDDERCEGSAALATTVTLSYTRSPSYVVPPGCSHTITVK